MKLLPPASAIVVAQSRRDKIVRTVAIGAGVLVVLVGLADLSSRVADAALGKNAVRDAFAPAASLELENAQNQAPTAVQIKIPSIGVEVPQSEIGHVPGLAGLSKGDYITVVTGAKAEVYAVKEVSVYHGRQAPREVVASIAPGRVVLLSPERDVAVIATPAYR